jgi:hypothetical protein
MRPRITSYLLKYSMSTLVKIHGIHSIEAPHPCHLVELSIDSCTKECEHLAGIIYPVLIDGVASNQAPFCEHFLSYDKGEILGDFLYGWDHPEIWEDKVRVAFLMHFLEPDRKIKTPYGSIRIPNATVLPKRLESIHYVSPY